MSPVVALAFAVIYAGMSTGRIPGLRIDRAGIALVAVALLLVTGTTDVPGIGRAVDGETLILLFALMVVSAQFALSGFYDRCVARIVGADVTPMGLLALTVAIGGVLSAMLANDIVVFAMTPLLCVGLERRGLNPKPFLLALAGAANAGSAATVIGNPQNILIGQVGHLGFLPFFAVCGVPALISLGLVFLVVAYLFRDQLRPDSGLGPVTVAAVVDSRQAWKGVIAVAVLVAMFVSPVPRAASAMAVAGLLMLSRRNTTRALLGRVDWPLLVLFLCLFTVTAVFGQSEGAARALTWLNAHGWRPEGIAIVAPLALAMSNTIGNVPAVILITAAWPDLSSGAFYALALFSTLAGNLLLVGSVANLIVAERASAAGLHVSFGDFARTGIPITAASFAAAAFWLWVIGAAPW